ncbi:NADH-quinone oxidoreductase subunit L [Termitidicoccus mucosus]|uniref:NADH-quinone oxidoreductase subunit 5 family protein n=1 Tax=Termitidicoccus mucosus TaxID=1184151 RepID=UPI0031839643
MTKLLWLIPALPLAAAAIGAVTPRRSRALSSTLALVAMAAGFVLSCLALRDALAGPAAHQSFNFTWLESGGFHVELGFLLDPLTAFMLVMVTFVGFLIFLFSTGYMKEDENYAKFFCYLSFFAASMLGLIVSNSLLLTFICWELVGLASYLLIGFWFTKPSAAAAAKKAFITTRIGDLGFLIGMLWLHGATDTLLFYDGGAGFLETAALSKLAFLLPCGLAVSTGIGLLVFCGAVGKSGQFPLHVWLPDAMEGPTPVSALIHAATMVAAGVFLIARVYPLMAVDQAGAHFHALTVVAFIGAITALFGAVVAVAQNDIKRILAFSTVSQLGYMMLAIGVGAWPVAIFHLLTHAFFKALLFGAGSVIHAAPRAGHPPARRAFAPHESHLCRLSIGMMALAACRSCFPASTRRRASSTPRTTGLSRTSRSASDSSPSCSPRSTCARLAGNVFFGKPRSHAAEHAHENPPAMTLPLTLLAACSILVGFLGTPAWPWLQQTLAGQPAAAHGLAAIFTEGGGLMWLSIALVALGIGAGAALYIRRPRVSATAADPLEKTFPALWRALANRLWFDELYAATFGRLTNLLAAFADILDRCIIDGLVRLLALLGRGIGFINREGDEDVLNGGFDRTSEALRGTGKAYSRAQTGDAHDNLGAIALGFVALMVVIMIAGIW